MNGTVAAARAGALRMPDGHADLQAFVRGELGCTCPPEVLARIECRQGVELAGVGTAQRLDVGGRLLVYVLAPSDDSVLGQLPALVRAGRLERDARGFNRLRLVLLSAAPSTLAPAAAERFAGCPDRDERVHLHVLPDDLGKVACAS